MYFTMCLEVFKLTIAVIASIFLLPCSSHENHNKKDKLVLNPVELIDLIRQEQNNMDAVTRDPCNYSKEDNEKTVTEDPSSTKVNEDRKDEDRIKSRKVWSRWSKWGDCSVTCGAGLIQRVRVCVAGRCAPGEREEQRRPCARAPCAPGLDASPDELHYLEK